MRNNSRSPLTPREHEVLRLIAVGMRSKQIANELGISFKTVVSHRTRLMEKLGLHNIAEVTRYALQPQEVVSDRELECKLGDALRAARSTYRAAAEENKRVIEMGKTAQWRLDAAGSQAIYRAGMIEREAMEKYAQALEVFADFVLRGRHPK